MTEKHKNEKFPIREESMSDAAIMRLTMENNLHKALERNEFKLA